MTKPEEQLKIYMDENVKLCQKIDGITTQLRASRRIRMKQAEQLKRCKQCRRDISHAAESLRTGIQNFIEVLERTGKNLSTISELQAILDKAAKYDS